MSAHELQIELDGISVAALHKTAKVSGAPKLLCIHGWLDNANSFLPLMPELDHCELLAIDLPGHGKSSHLPAAANYHLVEMPFLMLQISKQLGWEQFHLLGHSLGGCIAALTAVAAPEAIQSLMMIEASGPLTEAANELPVRLQKSREHRQNPSRFESRLFKQADEAVAARLAAAKMSRSSAELIIKRQIMKEDGGYRWRFDPRHRHASPVYMTEEQVVAILSAIECPVSVVIADQGYLINRPETHNRLQSIPACQIVTVSGHHHMHMDDPAPTAKALLGHLHGLER